ncbi:G1/S-specific cyclin-E1 [Diorhabda carinulata]|uniref:G1/S-specific cyclin-E1 n=1 Tax=Diorhabda carinulata TaxID=1163345 RepID=UPI0025A22855|nr:G1/S-specific cyclin-E1 [Diorhabda carinulata]XP_057658840.1 G1/S-specific cyclin-E1 [Diorhabda carinulata]
MSNHSTKSDDKRSLQSTENFKEYDVEKLNSVGHNSEGEYAETSKLSFQDLLRIHHKQTVWGFQFGKEARESSLARDKNKNKDADWEKCDETQTVVDSDTASTSSCKSITEKDHKTPHSRKRTGVRRTGKRKNSSKATNDFVSPQKTRKAPLPLMDWADSKEVWLYMVYKEEASLNLRNPRLFEDFSNFMPRMRAILLDWVMEVCEVYHLRRVTYYLCVDYFDRFLSIRPDVPKNQLQLVGVTCLFLASKLEEVYPPRLSEFSYVCDGACSPDEILACELLILNSLGWDLNIMTPSDWLNLYMQIHFQVGNVTRQKLHVDMNRQFFFPQYSGYQFTRASQLLDMLSLDPGFLKFSYSTIAAAAMYFMYGKTVALNTSGLSWTQLQPCAEYMAVFYHVIRDSPDPRLQSCKGDNAVDEPATNSLDSIRHNVKNLVKDENHSLQTHVVNMEYFEKSAIIRLEQMGLKVERTYVKKKKDKTSSSICEENSKENEIDDPQNYLCMYELEKLSCEAELLSDEELSITPPHTSDANLILPEENKAVLSFDEILEGIVKCNKKNIPLQELDSNLENIRESGSD